MVYGKVVCCIHHSCANALCGAQSVQWD